jgi:hypothetical protein
MARAGGWRGRPPSRQDSITETVAGRARWVARRPAESGRIHGRTAATNL